MREEEKGRRTRRGNQRINKGGVTDQEAGGVKKRVIANEEDMEKEQKQTRECNF